MKVYELNLMSQLHDHKSIYRMDFLRKRVLVSIMSSTMSIEREQCISGLINFLLKRGVESIFFLTDSHESYSFYDFDRSNVSIKRICVENLDSEDEKTDQTHLLPPHYFDAVFNFSSSQSINEYSLTSLSNGGVFFVMTSYPEALSVNVSSIVRSQIDLIGIRCPSFSQDSFMNNSAEKN